MAEFSIRSDSVDVEQIMKQIRGRIAEKRGVDYTEEQIRELANVRLEKFLDPKNLRSDLLEQFRRSRPAIKVDEAAFEAPYTFDDRTIFTSHRAPLRFIRKLLMPVLKLFFNPNTLNQVLHTQSIFNVDMLKRDAVRRIERAEWNALYYEVLHNMVLETTRMSIEVKNLKMRAESVSSRLDFSERRVRALEGVVQYRPEAMRPRERRESLPEPAAGSETEGVVAEGLGGEATGERPEGEGARRRRRRRRGRRGAGQGASETAPAEDSPESQDADHGDAGDVTTDAEETAEMANPAAGNTDPQGFGEPEGDAFENEGPDTDDTPSTDDEQ